MDVIGDEYRNLSSFDSAYEARNAANEYEERCRFDALALRVFVSALDSMLRVEVPPLDLRAN